jgi:hypothetical protein
MSPRGLRVARVAIPTNNTRKNVGAFPSPENHDAAIAKAEKIHQERYNNAAQSGYVCQQPAEYRGRRKRHGDNRLPSVSKTISVNQSTDGHLAQDVLPIISGRRFADAKD